MPRASLESFSRVSLEGVAGVIAMFSPPAPAWYVIHSRSRHEGQVETRLRKMGVEIFLPRVTVPSRRRDRRLLIEVPLFPGYLFMHSSLESGIFQEVVKIPGVVRILGNNGQKIPVPSETVESIRNIVESNRPYYSWPFLKEGGQVQIVDGPLAGTVGIILQRREKKRRLVVSVELFCRSMAVELADEMVHPWL